MRYSTYTGPSLEAEAKFAKLAAIADEHLAPYRAKLEAILCAVAQAHQFTPEEVTRPGRTRRLMAAKRDAALLTVEILCPPFSPEGVSDWINLSRSAIYRQLADARKQAAQDPQYAAHLDTLRARIRAAIDLSEGNTTRPLNTEDKSNG